MDFGAEDAGRLTPFKDDKPKDAENSPFEASSVLVVKAIFAVKTMPHYIPFRASAHLILLLLVR